VGTAVVHGLVGPKHRTRSLTPPEEASHQNGPHGPDTVATPRSAKGTASGYSRTGPAPRVVEQTGAIPDVRLPCGTPSSPPGRPQFRARTGFRARLEGVEEEQAVEHHLCRFRLAGCSALKKGSEGPAILQCGHRW
jgi:hypothetical protein